MLAIAAFDNVVAKRKLRRRNLMMTKQEVIDEMRTTEGNPRIKAMRRRRAYEDLAPAAASPDVATADVIITNPTHFAVATRLHPRVSGAAASSPRARVDRAATRASASRRPATAFRSWRTGRSLQALPPPVQARARTLPQKLFTTTS